MTNYHCQDCGKDVNEPCEKGTAVTMADSWKIINGKYIPVGKVWYLCGDCWTKQNKDANRKSVCKKNKDVPD